jgi:hypothetical protein
MTPGEEDLMATPAGRRTLRRRAFALLAALIAALTLAIAALALLPPWCCCPPWCC